MGFSYRVENVNNCCEAIWKTSVKYADTIKIGLESGKYNCTKQYLINLATEFKNIADEAFKNRQTGAYDIAKNFRLGEGCENLSLSIDEGLTSNIIKLICDTLLNANITVSADATSAKEFLVVQSEKFRDALVEGFNENKHRDDLRSALWSMTSVCIGRSTVWATNRVHIEKEKIEKLDDSTGVKDAIQDIEKVVRKITNNIASGSLIDEAEYIKYVKKYRLDKYDSLNIDASIIEKYKSAVSNLHDIDIITAGKYAEISDIRKSAAEAEQFVADMERTTKAMEDAMGWLFS